MLPTGEEKPRIARRCHDVWRSTLRVGDLSGRPVELERLLREGRVAEVLVLGDVGMRDPPVPELQIPPTNRGRVPGGGDGEGHEGGALPFGHDGVQPVEHQTRRPGERATAQAGARHDAIDLAPQGERREDREDDERDDRDRHARREQQCEDECETEKQTEQGDERPRAKLAGLLAQPLVENARRGVDPDAWIGREGELRGRGREQDRDQRRADGDLLAPYALQRRRRTDQKQWNDVEQIAVANHRVAEADAERRRLEGEECDRDQRERRHRVLVLASGMRDRRQHPPASEDQRYETAADRDGIEMPSRRGPDTGREQRTFLHRYRVDAEEAAERAREREDCRHSEPGGVDHREQTVRSERLPEPCGAGFGACRSRGLRSRAAARRRVRRTASGPRLQGRAPRRRGCHFSCSARQWRAAGREPPTGTRGTPRTRSSESRSAPSTEPGQRAPRRRAPTGARALGGRGDTPGRPR